MKLTPLELKKAEFKKVLRGYDEAEVRQLLDSASETLEDLIRENMELKNRQNQLSEKLKSYESLEKTLNDTLIMAQKSSESARSAADREAELIVARAEVQAEKLLEDARSELQGLKREIEMLGHERHAFLVKMRSLVASQWKLLQEESFTGPAVQDEQEPPEAVEQGVEQEQDIPDESEGRPEAADEPGTKTDGPEEQEAEKEDAGEDVSQFTGGDLSKQLGKILRSDPGEEAEKSPSAVESEEIEPPAGEEQDDAAGEFWGGKGEEQDQEGGALAEDDEQEPEKPEVFWGENEQPDSDEPEKDK